MHSATKYLGGHSDVIAGALTIKDKALGEELHFQTIRNRATIGTNGFFLGFKRNQNVAFTCTTSLRKWRKSCGIFEQSSFNWKEVYYPGLTSHPFHEIAKNK